MADLSTTPPRILHLHPSIQFITIPDTPGYQVVQTLRFSPPVIRLPIPNAAAAPTYILGELRIHVQSSFFFLGSPKKTFITFLDNEDSFQMQS